MKNILPKVQISYPINMSDITSHFRTASMFVTGDAQKIFNTQSLLATCFHAGFMLGLFFEPEDGDDMFPRNIG
jgi:hypothetical protein